MKTGIICDLSFNKHIGINMYYYALKNIFFDIKLVNNINDLNDIEILFIGNEHFLPHRNVWDNALFQKFCNACNIKVVVFSGERIFNSAFEHNTQIQLNLEKFENLYQYPYDVDDLEILKTNLFRPCISKKYLQSKLNVQKIDKCVFLGSLDNDSYADRIKTLKQIEKTIELVIPNRKNTWEEYIEEISNYRFVFNPLGNANGLNLRFYETLLVNSIPIQQVKKNTLLYYNIEQTFDDCIFFENSFELERKISFFSKKNSKNNIFLEDEILRLLKHDVCNGIEI